jgi:hypothetical protein
MASHSNIRSEREDQEADSAVAVVREWTLYFWGVQSQTPTKGHATQPGTTNE